MRQEPAGWAKAGSERKLKRDRLVPLLIAAMDR